MRWAASASSGSKTIRRRRSPKRSTCICELARRTNPRVRCAGVSLNTSQLERRRKRSCAGRAPRVAAAAGGGSDPRRRGVRAPGRRVSGMNRAPTCVHVGVEKWPLKAPFRITGHTFIDLDAVVVALEHDGAVGRGEAAGVYYLQRRCRQHGCADRSAAAGYRERHRSRVAASRAAGGRRAQRCGLRAVGPRSEARAQARVGACGPQRR